MDSYFWEEIAEMVIVDWFHDAKYTDEELISLLRAKCEEGVFEEEN